MGARRASTSAVVAVVGGVLLITLLVAWAATIGPGDVLRGDGPTVSRDAPSETVPTITPGIKRLEALDDLRERTGGPSDVVRVLAAVLQVLFLCGVLFGLYKGARWVLESWRERSRPEPPPEQVDFDVLDAPDVLVRAVTADAATQRDLLATGTPRNAIVEVWNRFEALAGSVGIRRRPWDTSSEFTLRMLDAMDADSAAVGRLAGLYREARFSDHEVTEEHRAAAVAALDTIHAGLVARGSRARP